MNPYIRPNLVATAADAVDHTVELELWLDEIDEVLSGREPASDSLRAFFALAIWGRFCRVSPELVEVLDTEGHFARLNQYVESHGRDLAAASVNTWDGDAWREAAEQLSASWEIAMPGEKRAQWSDELLAELDDADLVCCVLQGLGVRDQRLEGQVAECNRWLRDNASEFLAASVWVQAIAMAFRPDLAEYDSSLARTAEKFTAVLDAEEVAERWIHAPVRERVPLEVRHRLHGFVHATPPSPESKRMALSDNKLASVSPDVVLRVIVVMQVTKMLRRRSQAHLAARGTNESEARSWKPPPDSHEAAWLDRVELIRQAASGNVRYRATAFAKDDASVTPKTLLVALVAPDGTRSEVVLSIGESPVFPGHMADNWDELKMEVRIREDA